MLMVQLGASFPAFLLPQALSLAQLVVAGGPKLVRAT